MKIVLLDAKTLGAVPNLSRLEAFGEVISYESTLPEDTASRIKEADIAITNKVVIDAAVMNHCPNLKLICISATGTNNVDLEAAEKKGIQVKNAAGYSSASVAQHTFAMLLQLTNQVKYYDEYVKCGAYSKSEIFTHYGPTIFELPGKQYGIIGMGSIGRTVAAIAESFGAGIKYFSTSGKNTAQAYPSVDLEELLRESDVVSIHAPLNEHTRNLIDKTALSKMKPNAILINVGRGGIVDEEAIAAAIDNEVISGACIDVFESEPIQPNNPLLSVKFPHRLVLSPHNAWASIEARIRLVDIVVENIRSFLHN